MLAGLYSTPHGFTQASHMEWRNRPPILSVKQEPIRTIGLSIVNGVADAFILSSVRNVGSIHITFKTFRNQWMSPEIPYGGLSDRLHPDPLLTR